MTACMQEKLNEWRSKYFTRIIFRLKPSASGSGEAPAFTVVKTEELGIAKQMVIHNERAPEAKVVGVCDLVCRQGDS